MPQITNKLQIPKILFGAFELCSRHSNYCFKFYKLSASYKPDSVPRKSLAARGAMAIYLVLRLLVGSSESLFPRDACIFRGLPRRCKAHFSGPAQRCKAFFWVYSCFR